MNRIVIFVLFSVVFVGLLSAPFAFADREGTTEPNTATPNDIDHGEAVCNHGTEPGTMEGIWIDCSCPYCVGEDMYWHWRNPPHNWTCANARAQAWNGCGTVTDRTCAAPNYSPPWTTDDFIACSEGVGDAWFLDNCFAGISN